MEKVKRVAAYIARQNVPLYAANASFFLILSVFPLLEVLLVLQTVLFATMFMVLPNDRIRFRDSLPGALLATIGWQLFTNLYSVYSQKFTAYANIYGSVYVVALGMLCLYFCICIVFYGSVLNIILQKTN